MRFKMLAVALILALGVIPAFAQDSTTHTVSFDDFSFNFDPALATNVNISLYPGDAPDAEQPGGPEVRHTEFALYNSLRTEGIFDWIGNIRVYETADFANYEYANRQLEQLQTLLDDQSDLAAYTVVDPENTAGSALPYMPSVAGSQLIRAQPKYIETASVKGMSYVTVFRLDVAPIVGSEFVYTFQGISTDGARYISATFRLNTDLFPSDLPTDFDYDTFAAGFADYLTESTATLTAAAPSDFTPSLDSVDALVQSFAFG